MALSIKEELHQLRNKSLLIDLEDKNGAMTILDNIGFNAAVNEEGLIEITGKNAVLHPENVNLNLVNAGFPPSMLKVEEEDLESYFLRIISNMGVV